MLVYKEKQFLIFDFQDGKTVKYDFATKTCIGKKGKIVKNLCSQLSGISMNELIEACEDKQYAKFLEFVQRKWDYPIYNIGTILSKIPYYQRYEQIFSAGFEDICGSFSGTIKEIPKGLIKICKDHKITLSDELVLFYKENPNAYNLPYQMEFISLDDKDIHRILIKLKSVKEYYGENRWQYNWKEIGIFNTLLNEYGYTAKGLFNYLDYLKTFEAIEDTGFAVEEVYDYANMMRQISNKFDKYPRHFLTTHKIASRNYSRLSQQFEEDKFKARINKGMEKTFGDYTFIYPESTEAIKDEAVSQNNCVASYIKNVIEGNCHILFLRYKDSPDKSLVTIEVRKGKIVQARQKFNDPVSDEQQEVIDKWNTWYSKKYEEREELKDAS